MRAEELRIGNYIYYNDKIISIAPNAIEEFYYIGNTHLESLTDRRCYKPIPLTEEILLKCKGVVKLNEFQYKLNDWFLIERYTTKEKWAIRKVITEESSTLLCFIDYLHSFQNIVNALTGKELKCIL